VYIVQYCSAVHCTVASDLVGIVLSSVQSPLSLSAIFRLQRAVTMWSSTFRAHLEHIPKISVRFRVCKNLLVMLKPYSTTAMNGESWNKHLILHLLSC